MVSHRERRIVAKQIMTERGLSQRRICQLMQISRASVRYAPRRADEAGVVAQIREYAHRYPMYGYRMITALLKQDGYAMNLKRVYRVWRQEGLQLPRRATIKRRVGQPEDRLRRASHANELWTYDLLEARTERGGTLKMLRDRPKSHAVANRRSMTRIIAA